VYLASCSCIYLYDVCTALNYFVLSLQHGGGPAGQGGMHGAGGPGSNDDKAMHVRNKTFCFTVLVTVLFSSFVVALNDV